MINELSGPTVSLDVPSGIDATTGKPLGEAVAPDRTVTRALPKTGRPVPSQGPSISWISVSPEQSTTDSISSTNFRSETTTGFDSNSRPIFASV
ncbi:NAD(P)H-hydrate epimerase [Salinirubellus sp. GCM10025818]|uniref:NAD(P)H-hydrate epimerase n=1 Tax=Salinirubellus TaxID=2162630 RepID=UPI0030D53E2E